jgi:hypothetical protein
MTARSNKQKEDPKGILYKVNTEKKTCEFCILCREQLQNNDKFKCWSHMGSNGCGSMVLDILSCFNHKKEQLKHEKQRDALQKCRSQQRKVKSLEDSGSVPEEKATKRRKITQNKPNPILVVGNLQRDGWAVYEGINVSDQEKYTFLKHQLRASMKKSFVGSWNSIHGEKKSGTSRDVLKLHEIVKPNINEKINVINSLFGDIHNNVIKKVSSFENVSMDSCAILKNTNNVKEQSPHTNY